MKLFFKINIVVLLGLTLGFSIAAFLVEPLTLNLSAIEKIFFVFLSAFIPAAIFIIIALKKLILDPLSHINSVVKTIVIGNLSQRIRIQSRDEIGVLAQNFDTIINNLTKAMQNMANSLRDEKIKERELAENIFELDIAKAKDEALLSSIGDAVVAIDDQKRIILLNEAAGKMIGINPALFIGQPYSAALSLLSEKGLNQIPDFVGLALKGEKLPGSSRIVLQNKQRKLIPILYTISPILDKNRLITGVVLVLKDITRERELEILKDEFISVASHELRTPMTAIKGLISMIFEGDYGDINQELKDPLSDIGKSTERLITLVNDMLDVSRIEAGRIKFVLTDVSIQDIANDVVKTLKPIASQKNIKLEAAEIPLIKIRADADKVKQMTINLVSNALKFTDQGSITISARIQDKFAYISVTDTGIGISKENTEKLFGKFSQITSSQLGRPLGSGLGLYLSREFAKGMGGNMWLERSEPGKGSVFTYALPLSSSVL